MIESNLADIQGIYSENVLISEAAKHNNRSYLWHVAMPKSGTSWLTNIISILYKLNGWNSDTLVPYYGTRQQEIDPRRFLTSGLKGDVNANIFFVQQHCEWSEYTEFLVKVTKTKIIFQNRNIFDVMLSLRDHYLLAIKGNPESSIVPKTITNKSPDEIMDYLIDTKCGWYCEFLYRWMKSSLFHSNDFVQVRYENLKKNTKKTIHKINAVLSLGFTSDQIDKAVSLANKTNTRKNIGENNRSKKMLNDNQKDKILKISSYYKLPDDCVFFD